jgi:transcriptional regulator with XRE-family HTH domain
LKHPTPIAVVMDTVRTRRMLPAPEIRRWIRVRANLSQAEVAQAVGVSAAAVSHWEHGLHHPRGERLRRYVDLLDSILGQVGDTL